MNKFNNAFSEEVVESIHRLDRWLETNGWAGFDPYDIKGSPIFLLLQKSAIRDVLPIRVLRRIAFGIDDYYPNEMRRIFRIKRTINAKGMGLFAQGYLQLFQSTKQAEYLKKALQCIKWLLENPSPGYAGMAWGYPFDWQSVIFIPRGTPSVVVSCVIGDAFWNAYQVTGENDYLDVCVSICQFITNDLNMDRIDKNTICFSYTPLDDFHVHNANLFAAEYLVRIGKATGNQAYIDLGTQAANYALLEQNPDGSIYYWGKKQNFINPNHIDHYHSGFEMRLLYQLWKSTGRFDYYRTVESYYQFYHQNLIYQDNHITIPKHTPEQLYPVNIHSCSESILLNAVLASEFEEAKQILPGVVQWTINHMQTNHGWFAYQYRRSGNLTKIPYIRWGQAWMLLALAKCYTGILAEASR